MLRPSHRSLIVGLAFSSPLVVGLAAFALYPVLASFYFSLCDYPIFEAPQFIGLANYREMMQDPRIFIALWNTFYYATVGVPLGMICGLGLAMLLNLKVKGMALYRTVFFLPSVVPTELYESAEIDGAGAFKRLIHVTLPMISPVLLFTMVMGMIGTFQYFAQAYVMTGGGPLDSTLFYSLYLFNAAFSEYRLGYASAMAWVLFVVILISTAIVMRVSNKVVFYRS
jgi:multiple sugar transport system permease protein